MIKIAIQSVFKMAMFKLVKTIGFIVLLLSLSACVTEQFNSRTGERIDKLGYDRNQAGKIRMSLGLEYIKQGDMVNAKLNLEKAEQHLPKDPEVLLATAYFYEQVKNDERAEDYYERAVDADSSFGDTFNNFGTFLCRQKEYERADEMFNRAISLANYALLANSFENAGICAKESGNLQKSVRYLEQAIAYDSLRPLSLLTMAKVQLELHDLDAARYYLNKLSAIDKPSAAGLYAWARLEVEQGNAQAFTQYVKKLNTLFPDSPYTKKINQFNKKNEADIKQVFEDKNRASSPAVKAESVPDNINSDKEASSNE